MKHLLKLIYQNMIPRNKKLYAQYSLAYFWVGRRVAEGA